MASGIGRATRVALMNALFKSTTFTAVANTYISLHTASPGVDGQTLNEPSGNGYARVQVTINTGWNTPTAAEPSVVTNVADVVFPAATGAGWGTIAWFGMWRTLATTTNTDFLWAGEVTPNQAIAAGNIATIPLTTLVLNLNWTP